jgi:hypothetical protein
MLSIGSRTRQLMAQALKATTLTVESIVPCTITWIVHSWSWIDWMGVLQFEKRSLWRVLVGWLLLTAMNGVISVFSHRHGAVVAQSTGVKLHQPNLRRQRPRICCLGMAFARETAEHWFISAR